MVLYVFLWFCVVPIFFLSGFLFSARLCNMWNGATNSPMSVFGMLLDGMVQLWYGYVVWHGKAMVWHGRVWYGMGWNGMKGNMHMHTFTNKTRSAFSLIQTRRYDYYGKHILMNEQNNTVPEGCVKKKQWLLMSSCKVGFDLAATKIRAHCNCKSRSATHHL